GHQAPALGFGNRPRFLNAHSIAYFSFALFIMSVKLLVTGDHLLELRMGKTPFHTHHNRFGHLVSDDFAFALFAIGTGFGVNGSRGRSRGRGGRNRRGFWIRNSIGHKKSSALSGLLLA